MEKGAEAFRSIGEVAKLIGVAPHVLRYWETQFSQLKPVKRRDGRRYYRPDDVRLAAGLCEVLRDEGLTIRGAKKLLARDRGETVRNRGAARLGEAVAIADTPAPELMATAHTVFAAAPPAPQPAPITAPQAITAPEPDDHGPRARLRHRRREPDSLPLFPELSPPPVDWLALLAGTATALRAQPTGKRMNRKARAVALRLRDTLDTLF